VPEKDICVLSGVLDQLQVLVLLNFKFVPQPIVFLNHILEVLTLHLNLELRLLQFPLELFYLVVILMEKGPKQVRLEHQAGFTIHGYMLVKALKLVFILVYSLGLEGFKLIAKAGDCEIVKISRLTDILELLRLFFLLLNRVRISSLSELNVFRAALESICHRHVRLSCPKLVCSLETVS
jgi:hypothetical protein